MNILRHVISDERNRLYCRNGAKHWFTDNTKKDFNHIVKYMHKRNAENILKWDRYWKSKHPDIGKLFVKECKVELEILGEGFEF